jgi:hypothetical protein
MSSVKGGAAFNLTGRATTPQNARQQQSLQNEHCGVTPPPLPIDLDYKKAKFGVRLTQNAKLLHIIAATLTNRNIPSSQDGTCGLYGSLRVRRATDKRVEIRLFWRGTRRRLAGDPWLSSILAASLSGSRRTC